MSWGNATESAKLLCTENCCSAWLDCGIPQIYAFSAVDGRLLSLYCVWQWEMSRKSVESPRKTAVNHLNSAKTEARHCVHAHVKSCG